MASNGVTRPPALDVTMQEILDALKAVSFRPQVIDNLTSQDTGAPLSANQGRVLKGAIDGLVTQSITDGDTSHAPSGDAVHDAINAIITYKSTTVRNQTYMTSSASLYRVGSVVFMSYSSDLQNVPIGGFTMQELIPSGYRPITTAIFGERNQGIITIRVQSSGDVDCHNYSGQAQSAINGQFSACWITIDPLPS